MTELSQSIRSRLRFGTTRTEEAAIVADLASASVAELGQAILDIGSATLLSSLDDRTVRETFFAMLNERVGQLTTACQTDLVRALQRGRTSREDELVIRDIFLRVTGPALTHLKNELDEGFDYRNLHHLLYSDIDHVELREEILAHIDAQATGIVGRKVLSDIDDTFYSSLHDKRYPRGTVYPGIKELYTALAGPAGSTVFVTARPGDRLGIVEEYTLKLLRGAGLDRVSILAGKARNLRSHEAMGLGKLEAFSQFAPLYPEYTFVFIGDSGQGDAEFGAKMREQSDRVEAVWIHDVVDTPPDVRAGWLDRGVAFVSDYAEASGLAKRAGLIETA